MDLVRSTSNATQPAHSADLSVESKSQDALEQLAKEVQLHQFTTKRRLKKSLERRRRALEQEQTQDQYLVFTSVPPGLSSELSDERAPTSKYCRFSFKAETGLLITKVRPNPAHELATRSFDILIFLELHAMNVFDEMMPLGSATATVGNWTREPDCCWAPVSAMTRLSLAVEIGLSESARQLALSAQAWLFSSSSSVSLVVTISIHRQVPEITLRRWEIVPRGYGVVTRSSPPSAHCTTSLKLSRANGTTSVTGETNMNGTTTTTRQLELSFAKLVGRPPHQPVERDLILSEQAVRGFAEKIWNLQGLL